MRTKLWEKVILPEHYDKKGKARRQVTERDVVQVGVLRVQEGANGAR